MRMEQSQQPIVCSDSRQMGGPGWSYVTTVVVSASFVSDSYASTIPSEKSHGKALGEI